MTEATLSRDAVAVTPDPEQLEMLRESAADVVARSADFKRLRARRGTLPGFDLEQLQQMTDLGWLGILVPEAHGGLGLGLSEMAVVVQELGKGLMADPLVPLALATRVLVRAEDWAGAGPCLKAVAEGHIRPVVAWQEGQGGIDPQALSAQARRDGDGFRLSGRKRFVAGAAAATGFVVSATLDGKGALFWVDARAPGLALSHEWRADQTPSGVLALDDARVSTAQLVSRDLAPLAGAFDEVCVLAAAEMLGVCEAALQMALAYMRTRVQFGKPIGSFQALQHKAADLYVQQELVRAVLDEALREFLAPGHAAAALTRMASRCKARASDAGLRVTREVIQLHGAIGFTDEHDAGLYLKRALVLSAWLGNASVHRARFARLQESISEL